MPCYNSSLFFFLKNECGEKLFLIWFAKYIAKKLYVVHSPPLQTRGFVF